MKVRFWGVRGSIPAPGPETNRYGGNTSCVSITTAGGELVIIDSVEKIRAVELRLTATAAATKAADPHECRSTDQLRADAAMELLIHGDTDHLPDAARRIRAEVVVTVPVLSLLTGDTRIHGAAELQGVGPIPIETAPRSRSGSKTIAR